MARRQRTVQGYSRDWNRMHVLPRLRRYAVQQANALHAHRETYQRVVDEFARQYGCAAPPWWLVALVDNREHGAKLGLCNSHLHCGDSLSRRTVHVPAGRPAAPPADGRRYTFVESALDAMHIKGWHLVKHWTVEQVLYVLEPYNGLGYFQMGIPNPYLYSGSDVYDPPAGPAGKYVADHRFVAGVVDSQVGCAVLLRVMMEMFPDDVRVTTRADLDRDPETPPLPEPGPGETPAGKKPTPPIVVGIPGGGATGGLAAYLMYGKWALVAVGAAIVVAFLVKLYLDFRHEEAKAGAQEPTPEDLLARRQIEASVKPA